MVKTKNKKRFQADILSTKKSVVKSKKHNPFEVHTNKEKFSILGRQLKHDKGMPGVSRSKALKRRKDTLGQEYLNKNKTNSFKDKRIGERNMTKEEAASARFVAERLSQIKAKDKRKSLFNLNDDDILTHKGHTLEDIEQFEDGASDGDDDDEEIGKLDAEFTSSAHFGGGEEDEKDRKMAIDDLISEQKRRKNEISKEKEEVSEMTQLLDANWRNLLPLMGKLQNDDEVKPKPDDYDRALREMIFERRGEVSDKLKSDADILKEEKERLDKLEKDRLERMLGVTEEVKKVNHRSADDLDDGYYIQPVAADNQILAYDVKDDEKPDEDADSDEDLSKFSKENNVEHKENENENSEDDEEDEDGESDEDGEDGVDDDDDKSSPEEEEDNLSDLKDESDYETEQHVKSKTSSGIMESSSVKPSSTVLKLKKKNIVTEETRNAIMKKAAAELPYTFELPEKYDEFAILLKDRNSEYQNVILERMIKCNHPKVIPENKQQMATLFAYILQHINDVFSNVSKNSIDSSFMILDRICPHLYDLSHINPEETTLLFKGVIKEKQNDFREQEKRKDYPDLESLVFLKLVSSLYSTSDFRHHVCTPSLMFISQLLSTCLVRSRMDIAKGLFLVTTVLEYAQLSKRFLPSALNFLQGVLFLCVHKRPVEIHKIIPPFKSTGVTSELLVLSDEVNVSSFSEKKLKATDLIEVDIDDSFKVRALSTALDLTTDYLVLLSENIGAQYLAEPFSSILRKLPLNNYPEFVRQSAKNCTEIISKINQRRLAYIAPPTQKPKTLRMMEPMFDKVYDDKRSHKPGNKDALVRKGMMRKIKSETRGAIREIRRDNAFLSKIQLKRRMERDSERKEKVRRIFSEASLQQSELNAMDRKKKHL